MNKRFLLALMVSGTLIGLGGCSEGDDASITIEAPTTSTVDNSTTTTNPTPDPTPDPTPEPEACPTGTTEVSDGVCQLPASISSDLTLTAGASYLMDGRVTVGNGNGELGEDGNLSDGTAVQNVTLTVEAGVEIKGKTGTFANLVITRGSKIMAMGTKNAPIVMSSDDAGIAGAGELSLIHI